MNGEIILKEDGGKLISVSLISKEIGLQMMEISYFDRIFTCAEDLSNVIDISLSKISPLLEYCIGEDTLQIRSLVSKLLRLSNCFVSIENSTSLNSFKKARIINPIVSVISKFPQ